MFWYLFYNLLLTTACLVLSPVLAAIVLIRKKFRQGLAERLGMIPEPVRIACREDDPIWFHAVSVGEVMAIIPIVRMMRERHPDLVIVLSTTTVTGHGTALEKLPEADHVIYFPFDLYPVVRRSITAIRPLVFVHAETEIWPNFLLALSLNKIPSILVNGRISEKSKRSYLAFRPFFREVFEKIALFGMQTEEDGKRTIEVGAPPERVFVTGNMKYDQRPVDCSAEELAHLRSDLHIPEGVPVIVAGSTHVGEEKSILAVYGKLAKEHEGLVLILAPRHPERFDEVERIVRNLGLRVSRRTQIREHDGVAEVVVLDTIGELTAMYGLADVVFVGGTLVDVGGHNLLEPVSCRKAVLFGPHVQNTKESADLLVRSGGGIMVADADELAAQVERLLGDAGLRERLGGSAFRIVEENRGATERNIELIERYL